MAGDRREPHPGVRLVPFAEKRLEAMHPWLADPDLLRFTRFPEPPPPEFLESWYRRYVEGRADGTREAFAVVDVNDELVGLAVIPTIDRTTRTAELGYVVAPEARGRGVGTAALALLTGWAFDEQRLFRLELLIGVDNFASKRVASRCGYSFEGVLRSLYFKQGRHEDTEIWSRLATDPEPTQ
jgi:RimJ/RimL family protein N-acetyltransferase